MRCEEFEEYLSEYLEGETSIEQAERMELHTLQCPACMATVRGVQLVCQNMNRLAQASPSARFKLGLWSQVQMRHQARKRERRWRVLTLGVALGAALLILLWPGQQTESAVSEYASWEAVSYPEPTWRSATRIPVWREQLPEHAYSGLHAQAQVHLTAF